MAAALGALKEPRFQEVRSLANDRDTVPNRAHPPWVSFPAQSENVSRIDDDDRRSKPKLLFSSAQCASDFFLDSGQLAKFGDHGNVDVARLAILASGNAPVDPGRNYLVTLLRRGADAGEDSLKSVIFRLEEMCNCRCEWMAVSKPEELRTSGT